MKLEIPLPNNLKECPFCKRRGALVIEDIYDYNGNYTYHIGCINPECKIKPMTCKYDDISNNREEAINKACDDWNFREG